MPRANRYRLAGHLWHLCGLLGTTGDKLAPLQNEWIATALANRRTG